MVNTRTASTINLAPATTLNNDPVQPVGNAPPGPSPNSQVQVGKGVTAPGGGGNPPQPPTGPSIGKHQLNPINFSLTPGAANLGYLDYFTKRGYHHYTGATDKLEEELYDCTPYGFYQFTKSLKVRSDSYKWTPNGGIFWMAKTVGKNT